MNPYIRPLARFTAVIALAATITLGAAGCTPQEGGKCNPKTDSEYYSTHTDNGKTKTVHLECRQVGIDKYEWRKPT